MFCFYIIRRYHISGCGSRCSDRQRSGIITTDTERPATGKAGAGTTGKSKREAIQQAKSQYEHYKSVTEGNDKLGAFLNDPYVNQLLPVRDWQDIYNQTQDLTDLRKRYGVSGYEPQEQKFFDSLLMQVGVLEEQYKATNTRIKHAEGLRQQLDTVTTPKEREQLALRYQQERLELEAQQAQLQNTRYLMEEKKRLEKQKNAQDFLDYMDGKRDTLPEIRR